MDLKISLTNLKQLERQLKKHPVKLQKAKVDAVNRTAKTAQTQGAKNIGQELNLNASYIKSNLKIRQATKNKAQASVNAVKRGTLLTRYFAKVLVKRQKDKPRRGVSDTYYTKKGAQRFITPAGVAVKVKKKGGMQKMPGAFLIRLKRGQDGSYGGYGIAIRTGKGRNAYKVLHGPSLGQAWDRTKNDISQTVYEKFENEIIGRIRYELSKIK